MLALGRQWIADTDTDPLRRDLGREAAGAASVAEGGTCRCGRRRPVGVLLGLRSGARPRFEGRWFCRKGCLREALEERARRDFPDAGTVQSRVQHRVPLGLMLQARGVVTGKQLQEALRVQDATGQRLGDVLQTHFGIAEERITHAIAAQWGLPVLHLPPASATPPQDFAPLRLFQASGSFPVQRTASGVLLACADGPDHALAFALERMYPLRAEFGVVSSPSLDQWRKAHAESAVPVQRVRCNNRGELAAQAADLLTRLQPVDCRIVRINGLWWMRMWLEEAARRQTAAAETADTLDVLYSIASDASATSPR